MGAVQSIADHFHIRKANIIEDGGMDNVSISASGVLYEMRDDDVLSDDERRLLALYRACGEKGRESLMNVAAVTARIFGES